MKMIHALCLAALGLAPGCSLDSMNRIAYSAASGMQQQRCIESPMAQKQDCMQIESYEEYQRKRSELNAPG